MLHPSPTDDWVVAQLREVETPRPPDGVFVFAPRPARIWRWLVPASLATAAAIPTILLALHPAPTLAQVLATQAQMTRFELVNTRFTTDGGHFSIRTYRDGKRWSSFSDGADGKPISRTVMDGGKTLTLYTPRRGPAVAIMDEPDPMAQVSFDLKLLVRQGKPYSLTRTTWKGQAADRFEAHSTYPGIKGPETLDQLIFADATSHLPLHMEVFRNRRTWGDTWDFSYSSIPESVFDTSVEHNTRVFDLRAERAQLKRILGKAPVVLLGFVPNLALLIPAAQENVTAPFRIDGLDQKLQRNLRTWYPRLLINGRTWREDVLLLDFTQTNELDALRRRSSTTVTVGKRKIQDVRIIQVGLVDRLLRPFSKSQTSR